MDLIKSLGELAVGSRLKRLSDLIMKDGIRIYQSNGIDFQPKWFPVFYALSQNPRMGVTQIAQELGLAHPTVSQTIKELESRGLVKSRQSREDARKREISLSKEGIELVPQMEPLWRDISNALYKVMTKSENNLLAAVEELEKKLDEKGFCDRVEEATKERQLEEVQILDYQPEYQSHFRELNYQWIEEFFEVEDLDRKILDDPENYILEAGGDIVFARLGEEIIGTCALIKLGDGTYELAKMAVAEKARGKQIGKKLGEAVIQKARNAGAKRVILESNKKLTPALNLYEKLGFRVLGKEPDQSMYCRANIKMELILEPNNE